MELWAVYVRMLMTFDSEKQPTNEKDEEHNTPSVSRIAEFVADIRNEVEGKRH